jgi:glycerate kinase
MKDSVLRVLIAPNAFKNSLSAEAAALAIQQGLNQSKLNCICECFPIADGGDGTGSLIIKKCNGILVEAEVHDPLGRKINATFGLIDNGNTAVIEMAEASGIRLLKPDELAPLKASTFGTGELIKNALNKGVKKIILAMGGSATVDAGSGILSALGIRFLNTDGDDLLNIPANLADLSAIDLSDLDKRILNCELIILCDVNNILLGDQGAARVFGPQKGASPADVLKLEASLTKFAEIALQTTGKNMAAIKHGGTAGGAAAGLHTFLNAKLVNGIDEFLRLTGFEDVLDRSDIVITGEGSLDEQTLQGKGPLGVANRAKLKGIPVIGLAGKVPLMDNSELNQYFDVLLAIGNEPTDLPRAMDTTTDNLIRTSTAVGNLLTVIKPDKKQ